MSSIRIAIVASRFNSEITQPLVDGGLLRLQQLGIAGDNVALVWVPGAIELPLMAQRMAQTGRYAAIICYGAVIRGDTDHYDTVCQSVAYGCQRVALSQNLPVVFGVLTTHNEEQALARVGGSHGHKGYEAAEAAVAMVQQLEQLDHARQSHCASDIELVEENLLDA